MSTTIRDTLFGDLPLDEWPSLNTPAPDQFPWSEFVAARGCLERSDTAAAVACWKKVADAPGLEPRQWLQAWHFLRQFQQRPPAGIAKTVLGVVVEVGMPKGLDLLAAYRDRSARYWNFSGAGVVWEHPDDSLDPIIDSLLSVSANVVAKIGPSEAERPPAPPTGQARLSFLTPSGLHFGQATMSTMASDALAGRVFQIAAGLMQALIAKAKSKTKWLS